MSEIISCDELVYTFGGSKQDRNPLLSFAGYLFARFTFFTLHSTIFLLSRRGPLCESQNFSSKKRQLEHCSMFGCDLQNMWLLFSVLKLELLDRYWQNHRIHHFTYHLRIWFYEVYFTLLNIYCCRLNYLMFNLWSISYARLPNYNTSPF